MLRPSDDSKAFPKGNAVIKLVAGFACVLALSTGCAATSGDPTTSTSSSPATHVNAGAATPIRSWFQAVNPKISAVEQSITYAQWAVRRPDHRGLAAACRAIDTKIDAFDIEGLAPDKITRDALRREMAAFRDAARECVAGDLDSAGRSVIRGHQWAEVAGKRVVRLLHAAD